MPPKTSQATCCLDRQRFVRYHYTHSTLQALGIQSVRLGDISPMLRRSSIEGQPGLSWVRWAILQQRGGCDLVVMSDGEAGPKRSEVKTGYRDIKFASGHCVRIHAWCFWTRSLSEPTLVRFSQHGIAMGMRSAVHMEPRRD